MDWTRYFYRLASVTSINNMLHQAAILQTKYHDEQHDIRASADIIASAMQNLTTEPNHAG